MIVGVQGTPNFNNYQIFLRSMAVALSELKENQQSFILYSAGPSNINAMAMEFTNLSERGMKSRGKVIKLFTGTPDWLAKNFDDIDHFIFLSNPKEPVSKIVHEARSRKITTNVYTF
jgi:hypothetical protein